MQQRELKLNLGCGPHIVNGWVNVDAALGARLAKIPFFNALNQRTHLLRMTWDRRICLHDLRKRLPWQDASIDVIYSSHLLEHFSKRDGAFMLNECHRVLKPHGLLRMVVPDFRILVERYLNGSVRAEDFATIQVINYEDEHDGFWRKKLAPFLRSPHKCMYDASLVDIIRQIGFDASCRKPFESDIPDIRMIEVSERTYDVVIVEGRKKQ